MSIPGYTRTSDTSALFSDSPGGKGNTVQVQINQIVLSNQYPYNQDSSLYYVYKAPTGSVGLLPFDASPPGGSILLGVYTKGDPQPAQTSSISSPSTALIPSSSSDPLANYTTNDVAQLAFTDVQINKTYVFNTINRFNTATYYPKNQSPNLYIVYKKSDGTIVVLPSTSAAPINSVFVTTATKNNANAPAPTADDVDVSTMTFSTSVGGVYKTDTGALLNVPAGQNIPSTWVLQPYSNIDNAPAEDVTKAIIATALDITTIGDSNDQLVPLPTGYTAYKVNVGMISFIEGSSSNFLFGVAGLIVNSDSTSPKQLIIALPDSQKSYLNTWTEGPSGQYTVYSTTNMGVPTDWSLYYINNNGTKVFIASPSSYNPPSSWSIITDLSKPLTAGLTFGNSGIVQDIVDNPTVQAVAKVIAVVGVGSIGYLTYLVIVSPDRAKKYLQQFSELKDVFYNTALLLSAFAFIAAISFITYEFALAYKQAGSVGGALGLLTANTLKVFVEAFLELIKDLVQELEDFISGEVSSIKDAL